MRRRRLRFKESITRQRISGAAMKEGPCFQLALSGVISQVRPSRSGSFSFSWIGFGQSFLS
jgi:hypothetical protein